MWAAYVDESMKLAEANDTRKGKLKRILLGSGAIAGGTLGGHLLGEGVIRALSRFGKNPTGGSRALIDYLGPVIGAGAAGALVLRNREAKRVMEGKK